MNVKELTDVVEELRKAGVEHTVIVQYVVNATDGNDEPLPPPVDEQRLRVRPDGNKGYANAWFVKGRNKSGGRPIMNIYPSNMSKTKERVRFRAGAFVMAVRPPVKADGGSRFWRLSNWFTADQEDLYLRQVDVVKV